MWIFTLNLVYLYDSMVTWVVRAHDGVTELNPVISELQQIDPMFYVAFRGGVLLLIDVLLWQICLEAPRSSESRWFKLTLALGILIYVVPLAMSFHLLL